VPVHRKVSPLEFPMRMEAMAMANRTSRVLRLRIMRFIVGSVRLVFSSAYIRGLKSVHRETASLGAVHHAKRRNHTGV
jgi:hypothetical protein